MIIRNGRQPVRIHNVKTEHLQGDIYHLRFDGGYRGHKRSFKILTRNMEAIEKAQNYRYKKRKSLLLNSHERQLVQQLATWCAEIDFNIQN